MLRKELFIALLCLLPGIFHVFGFANYIFAIAFFYFIFRYLIVLVSADCSSNERKYIISRYNLFLLIHGFVFLLLSAYLGFDYMSTKGDWFFYDHHARIFTSSLKDHSAWEFQPASPGQLSGRGYVVLVGLLYYFFNYSVNVAVLMNVFFAVSNVIISYILLNHLFNHQVAKRAMYFSAFFPVFFLWELLMWKECFSYFLVMLGSLAAVKVSINWETRRLIRNISLLVIIMLMLYNVRFYYLFPILFYVMFSFLFYKYSFKRLIFVLLVTGLVWPFVAGGSSHEAGPVQHEMLVHGASVTDESRSFNYQVDLTNPLHLIKIILTHPAYFIVHMPKMLITPWIMPVIYQIPYISPTVVVVVEDPVAAIISYMSGAFLWLNIFVGFLGLKNMIMNRTKDSTIIWLTLFLIPVVLSINVGITRYLGVLTYFVIMCIAFGLEDKKYVKTCYISSMIVSFAVMILANRNTPVFKGVIACLGALIPYFLYRFIWPSWRRIIIRRDRGI